MQSVYALLVIDMQFCGFDGKITPEIENGTQLLDKIADLIAISRSNKLPIVYIQHCGVSGQPYSKDMHGWDIHPAIPPKPNDKLIFKKQSNGFEGTNLGQCLEELGIQAVITCGVQSEHCVSNTSLAALNLGFEVYLVSDAHGTVSSDELHADTIIKRQNELLERHGAWVSDLQGLRKTLNLA